MSTHVVGQDISFGALISQTSCSCGKRIWDQTPEGLRQKFGAHRKAVGLAPFPESARRGTGSGLSFNRSFEEGIAWA